MGHEQLHAFHHLITGYVECVLICTSCAALNSIDTEEYPLGVENIQSIQRQISKAYMTHDAYICTGHK